MIPTPAPDALDAPIRRGARVAMANAPLSPSETAGHQVTYVDNLAHDHRVASECAANGDHRQAARKSWGAGAPDSSPAIPVARGRPQARQPSRPERRAAGRGRRQHRKARIPAGAALNRGATATRARHRHGRANGLRGTSGPGAAAAVLAAARGIARPTEVRA